MYKYSVLIPAYNEENSISKALDSIIKQNNNFLEIVVIDDGSNDSTPVILDDYAKRYPFINVIHQENVHNLLRVRCSLIDNAMGKYLLFLDADDCWSDDFIETIDYLIEKEQPDCILYENNLIQGDKIRYEKRDFEKILSIKETRKLSLLFQIVSDNKFNSVCYKCFKKSLFNTEDLKDLNVSIGEDTVLNLNALVNAEKISYVNKPLYQCHVVDGSVTSSYKPSYFNDFKNVCTKMKEAILKVDAYDDFERSYAKRMVEMIVAPFGRLKIKNKEIRKIYKDAFYETANNNEWIELYKKYKNDFMFIYKWMSEALIKKNYSKMLLINWAMNCSLANLYFKWRRNVK